MVPLLSRSGVAHHEGIDLIVGAHRQYLAAQYERGDLLLGGRKIPRTGGIILSRQASREEVDDLFRNDPLVVAGAATFDIIEFEPVMYAQQLTGLSNTIHGGRRNT